MRPIRPWPEWCLVVGQVALIIVRRSGERPHYLRGRREDWFTFQGQDSTDPLMGGFGSLELLNEHQLPAGAHLSAQPQRDAEILTYVREGRLAHESTSGRSGIIHAGEFQRRTRGRGARHKEANASRTDGAHVLQLWLRPSRLELAPGEEQKRFSAAERRGALRVVAAPDARQGSLRIQLDALVYSALLDLGQHVVHELLPGRKAWLHLVHGEATLGDLVLTTGDGAGIAAERVVACTARKASELLLVDLGEH